MKAKFEFLLKNKGLNATSLARMLEIQPSGLSHILSGRNKPSFDLVVKILRIFPDINPDWLLLDSDQIFRSDDVATPQVPSSRAERAEQSSVLPFDEVANREVLEGVNGEKNELPPIFTTPRNPNKKVERVIILYSDRSFESYSEL